MGFVGVALAAKDGSKYFCPFAAEADPTPLYLS